MSSALTFSTNLLRIDDAGGVALSPYRPRHTTGLRFAYSNRCVELEGQSGTTVAFSI